MVASPVADVVARMEEILTRLPSRDGVACFTRLYLSVTQDIRAHVVATTFADPPFLAQLDAAFAALFFAAVDGASRTPPEIPHAWAPLFDARRRRGIAPLQFAFAGMNAHINRDLPVALVSTCREAGVALEEGSPQHADFVRVNGLLADVEARVKREYVRGWLRAIDRVVHRLDRIDDVLAMWDVARARDAAWTNAEALWALRDEPQLSLRYLDVLDRSVGFAGRGVLVPADTWLQRLARVAAR
jgi:hypothetical protein